MLPSILSPLLDDSRLTMPEMKIALVAPNVAASRVRRRGTAWATRNSVSGASAPITTPSVVSPAMPSSPGSALSRARSPANTSPVTPASTSPVGSASTNPPAAPGSISHVLQNLSMPKAMGYGALAGAAKGLIDPGSYTDENGNVQQRSRISAVLGNAATGAALGAVSAPLIRGGAKMHAAMPVEAAVPGAAGAEGKSTMFKAPVEAAVPGAAGAEGKSTMFKAPAAPATQSPIVPPAPATQNSPNTSPVLSLPPVAINPLTGAPGAQSNGISLNAGTPIGKKKTASLLPSVGPALKSASAQGNLDATINPMIAGVPSRTGDNSDSCGQISMDASTAKISAKAETSKLDASLNASIDTKKSKPGSAPFKLPALNLSKKK